MTAEEIIEENKDYLKKNDLKGFYDKLCNDISIYSIGLVTQYFYEMGADPLEYMDEIPYGFLARTDIKSFTIPTHIKKICDSAFSMCDNLKSIVIPEGVTVIDGWAFFHCRNLTSIKLPDSLEEIGEYAFEGCENIVDINVPKNLKKVHSKAFLGCAEEIYEKFKDFI